MPKQAGATAEESPRVPQTYRFSGQLMLGEGETVEVRDVRAVGLAIARGLAEGRVYVTLKATGSKNGPFKNGQEGFHLGGLIAL